MVLDLKRVLWPTDFSSLSLHGGRYARGFCKLFKSELHIVHVIPPPLAPDVSVTLPTEVPMAYAEPELVDACRAQLRELVSQHFAEIPEVKASVFFGNPWSSICKYAGDAEIDLVVVATHGRTGLQHVVIGSTAERIVQHAPCPVLVVKNPQKDFVTE